MNILHRPLFDTDKIAAFYSLKDGVSVKYVCTTERSGDNLPRDIFYRDTPHPIYGNKYFGLYSLDDYWIQSADWVEKEVFSCVSNGQQWVYSRYRHDYFSLPNGVAIDGGRAYMKIVGNSMPEVKHFVVRDGGFVEK